MKPDLSGLDPLHVNLAQRLNVGDGFARAAAMFPDRAAVVDRGESVTFARMANASRSLGGALLDVGCAHQSPVTMFMGNSWRFLATYMACASAGLVAMPVNVLLSIADLAWILTDAGTETVVADAMFVPLLEAVLPRVEGVRRVVIVGEEQDKAMTVAGRAVLRWEHLAGTSDARAVEVLVDDRDTVQCLYTSGTTSQPKGVLVSHASVLVATLTNALAMDNRNWSSEPDVIMNVLPLFHTTALNTLALPFLLTGGTVVLPGPFEPAGFVESIQRYRTTHLMLLPVMWRAVVAALAAAPHETASVRKAIYAMAPMGADLLELVDQAFPNAAVILGSGQTEVVPATVLQWPEHRHTAANSWGPSVPSVLTRCLAVDGSVLPPGETGEIAYRSPHVSSGYWNNRDANTVAFAHGWFHSGDVGHVDEAGVVWFTDRIKDIIKTGGENVSSVDVERVVTSVPGVAECSVVGLPDDRWGEAVCAVVIPDGTVSAAELPERVIAYTKSHLAGFQVPKRVFVVEQLPKTATGKTRKHELRDLLRS
jgi:acyl-CoA synthetase (AMP-forming)/AMP-acid ligase II